MPGGEVWSINPCYGVPQSIALNTDELAAIALSIDGVTVPAGLMAMNTSGVSVTGCRVEARTHAGVLEGVAEHARATPVAGTGTNGHPFQTSIVASLRTADSSARGKGRLYWPATAIPITASTLRIPTSDVNTFVTSINTYLTAIRGVIRPVAGLTGASLAVWSRTNADHRIVLSIRAGDIADVQRRRRDALTESYLAATVSSV